MGFYSGKKVLVTGATGFLGTHFVKHLLKQGALVYAGVHSRPLVEKNAAVVIEQGDLSNPKICRRACAGKDYVFHIAGTVAAAGKTGDRIMTAITTNLVLTARMLEAAWKEKVKRIFIFSSGTTAYPDSDSPLREEDMFLAPPPACYFGYGNMRRYLELLSQYVHRNSQTKVAICRPTTVYGWHDNFDKDSSHFIPALIRRAVEKEDPYVVWGTGNETRDILHADDLARGSLLLLEKHAEGDPVNIGAGVSTPISEVVRLILGATGHKPQVVYDATKPSTIMHRAVDTSKAGKLLGFKPEISLADGIRDTVEWYKKELK